MFRMCSTSMLSSGELTFKYTRGTRYANEWTPKSEKDF